MKTCLHWLIGGSLLLSGAGCGDGSGAGGQSNPALDFVGTGSTGQGSTSFAAPPAGGKGAGSGSQGFVQENPTGGEGPRTGGGGSGVDGSRNLSELSSDEVQQLCQSLASTVSSINCPDIEDLGDIDIAECVQGVPFLGSCGLTVGHIERCFGGLAAACDPSGCSEFIACVSDDDPPTGGFDAGVDGDPPMGIDAGPGTGVEADCSGFCANVLECAGEQPECESNCEQLVSTCGQAGADYVNSCASAGCDTFFQCVSMTPDC